MFTGVPASQGVIDDAKTPTRGKDRREEFLTRFIDFDDQSGNKKSVFDSIPKQPLLTFPNKMKKLKVQAFPKTKENLLQKF